MNVTSTRNRSMPHFYNPTSKIIAILNLFSIPYLDKARLKCTINAESIERDPSYLIDFLYKKYSCKYNTFVEMAEKVEEILNECAA